MADQDLASAAADALPDGGDPGGDDSLVPMHRIQFLGVARDQLEDPPELGAKVKYLVTGTVIEKGRQLRKDGEVRFIVKVDTEEVEPAEI